MADKNTKPSWLQGASIGAGMGAGISIGRGADQSFAMKLAIGAIAAVLVTLAMQFILGWIYTRRQG